MAKNSEKTEQVERLEEEKSQVVDPAQVKFARQQFQKMMLEHLARDMARAGISNDESSEYFIPNDGELENDSTNEEEGKENHTESEYESEHESELESESESQSESEAEYDLELDDELGMRIENELRIHLTKEKAMAGKIDKGLGPDLTDESTEGDGTLTRYESLHMGHFEKMMSKNHAKDSDGKGIDESTEWSVTIFDTSQDGFQKLENEPTNHVEGKEDHSVSDSEFDNQFNQFRKARVENDPTKNEECKADHTQFESASESESESESESASESASESESETDNEEFHKSLDKLIKTMRTEQQGKEKGLDKTDESIESNGKLTRYEGKVDLTQPEFELVSEFNNLLKSLDIGMKKLPYNPGSDNAGKDMGVDEITNNECSGTLIQYIKYSTDVFETSLLCSRMGNQDKEHLSTKHSISKFVYV